MRHFIFLIVTFLLIVETASGSSITRQTFFSDTVGREYTYLVYLPDGYEKNQHKHYPVAYLLHGSFVDETYWTNTVDVKPQLDRLILNQDIPPSIVVMPGSKSWWIDGHNENAETAFMEDLVPHIEERWRTIQKRSARIIAGISAGGYGTVNFAMKYPEFFVAGAAFSPASYEGLPPQNSSAYRHPAYLDENQKFDSMLWQRSNYIAHISAYRGQDQTVALYINSGDHDFLDIAYHATVLYRQLRAHQPDKVELRIVDGDHEPSVWIDTFSEAMKYVFKFVKSDVSSDGVKP